MKKIRAFLKEKLNRKKEASDAGMDLVFTSLCVMTMMVIVVSSVHFIKITEAKREITAITAENILTLESRGELSDTDLAAILMQINDLGFKNYSVTANGTVVRTIDSGLPSVVVECPKVPLGEKVSLYIEVNTTAKELGLSKVYEYIRDEYTITAKKASTSKM